MAPITRICSLIALALGSSAMAARQQAPSALHAFVQARFAAADGESDQALRAYAEALRAEPGNTVIALPALREAVEGGDRLLAIRAAETLAATDALPADGALLLIGSRLQSGNVAGSVALLDKLKRDAQLPMLVPVLQSWVGLAAGDPGAAAKLGNDSNASLGTALTLEQRALADLQAGRKVEAASLIRSAPAGDLRTGVTRITAAATLQKQGDKAGALALMQGEDPSFAIARQHINANRPLGGEVDTPVKGLAFFYARLATDLVRDNVPNFAMTLARYGRFLDPKSPFVAMAEAQALAANELDAAALQSLEAVRTDSPYAAVAFESRLALLQRLDRGAEAVTLATQAAQSSRRAADHIRLGDILSRERRFAEAAQAYDRALSAEDLRGAPERWGMWMLRGSALVQAQDWSAAEAALREAMRLAPDQAFVLNYLGYSLLERREKIDEALGLVKRAAALKPDDAAITDSLGWAYFLTGDFDRAITTLEAAQLADPTEPTISEHLGDAYWQAGRRIDARYSWRAALLTAEDDAIARLTKKVDLGLTRQTQAP